jgi:hypothetical protein
MPFGEELQRSTRPARLREESLVVEAGLRAEHSQPNCLFDDQHCRSRTATHPKGECMTDASVRALEHLRDFSMLKCYVIPLLAVVLFIYAVEMRKARSSGNWDPVLAGLTLFGMDLFNDS